MTVTESPVKCVENGRGDLVGGEKARRPAIEVRDESGGQVGRARRQLEEALGARQREEVARSMRHRGAARAPDSLGRSTTGMKCVRRRPVVAADASAMRSGERGAAGAAVPLAAAPCIIADHVRGPDVDCLCTP